MKIIFPPSTNVKQIATDVLTERSVVVIGANGAGKTRFGTHLEFGGGNPNPVHRIAAQKSLTFPGNSGPIAIDIATRSFQLGTDIPTWTAEQMQKSAVALKRSNRWGSNPETYLLNDFEKLVVLLFSENYNELLNAAADARAGDGKFSPPITRLDTVKEIWDFLLPHRELVLHSGAIGVRIKKDQAEYKASELSDGERVIFYMIGQCLCAEKDSIIVVDEPEIHLHKSLQNKLWDRVEATRPDCLFVYLTHDLTFASDRSASKKICLRGFDGQAFDWYEVPETQSIPEDVLFEVLGSRRSVLFVEGDQGSHDLDVYQSAYPNFTIKPLGSCEKVIEATKAFKNLEEYHHLRSFGIVDRDHKSEAHLKAYESHGVFAPQVAETENVFLVEEVLLAVAMQLCIPDARATVEIVKRWVLEEFDKHKNEYALNITKYAVNSLFGGYDGSAATIEEYQQKLVAFNNALNPEESYRNALAEAQKVIDAADYGQVIRMFNHKGLLGQVGKFFGLKPSSYVDKVKHIAAFGAIDISKLMMPYLPRLE